MIKSLLNGYTKLGILFLVVSLCLTNCQNDDDLKNEIVNVDKPELKIAYVNFEQVKVNKALLGKIEDIFKGATINVSNLQSRIINSNHGFSINTDYATYLESEDATYHSYTFPVSRTPEIESLENLVFSLQDDGTYSAFLTTYDLTIEEQDLLFKGTYIDLTDKLSAIEIENTFDMDDVLSKIPDQPQCVEWSWQPANTCPGSDQHDVEAVLSGEYCPYFEAGFTLHNGMYVNSIVPCTNSGGGDNTDDGNNSGGDTSGGHQEGGTNGLGNHTSPTCSRNCIDPASPEDPHVQSLNEITGIPEVKAELDRLKNNMGFSTQEDGKRFIYTGNDISDTSTYTDANFDEQPPTVKESDALFFPPLANNTLIGAHFHPDLDNQMQPIRKVPSGTDIAEHIVMVKKMAETNPTTPPQVNQVTNFVVSKGSTGKTYAIRTNNEQSIVNLEGDFTKEGKERKIIAEELGKIILAIPAGQANTNQLQEEAIAAYLLGNFPSLSIYVAVYNPTGEIINWIKL